MNYPLTLSLVKEDEEYRNRYKLLMEKEKQDNREGLKIDKFGSENHFKENCFPNNCNPVKQVSLLGRMMFLIISFLLSVCVVLSISAYDFYNQNLDIRLTYDLNVQSTLDYLNGFYMNRLSMNTVVSQDFQIFNYTYMNFKDDYKLTTMENLRTDIIKTCTKFNLSRKFQLNDIIINDQFCSNDVYTAAIYQFTKVNSTNTNYDYLLFFEGFNIVRPVADLGVINYNIESQKIMIEGLISKIDSVNQYRTIETTYSYLNCIKDNLGLGLICFNLSVALFLAIITRGYCKNINRKLTAHRWNEHEFSIVQKRLELIETKLDINFVNDE